MPEYEPRHDIEILSVSFVSDPPPGCVITSVDGEVYPSDEDGSERATPDQGVGSAQSSRDALHDAFEHEQAYILPPIVPFGRTAEKKPRARRS